MVEDFGVKYVGKEHADHLIACIKEKYKLTKDWMGDLYCGINLKWDYIKRTLEILMPGYIKRLLLKYKHVVNPRPQHCPYSPEPLKYGSEAQAPLPPEQRNNSTKMKSKRFRKLLGASYIMQEW
jgi:hypothetical protein